MIELLILLLLLLVIIISGRRIQKLLYPTADPLGDIIFSFGFGSILLIVLVYLVAWLGLLSSIIIITLLCALFLFSIQEIPWLLASLQQLDFSWTKTNKTLTTILGIFLFWNLIGALAPTTDSDGLAYHLEIPKYYLEQGGFAYHPMIVSTWPLSLEMLYTVALALSTDSLAKLIHLIFGLGTALATYYLGRKLFNHETGLWAAAIFYTIPLISLESGIAYNDLGMVFFATIGIIAWTQWMNTNSTRSLLTSAVLLGSAASMKWNGPIIVAILTIMSIFFVRKQRNTTTLRIQQHYTNHQKIYHPFSWIILFVLISAMFPMMWYAKNAVLNGNPFGVFAANLFHARNWTQEHSQAYFQSVSGLDYSFLHMITAPFKLILSSVQYGELSFLGPVFLMLIPLLFWCQKEQYTRTLGIYCILFYAVWFWTSQQSRLLIPIFPILALLASRPIAELKNLRKILLPILLASMLLNSAFAIGYHGKGLLVAIGLENKETYLEQIRPVYPVFTYANTHLPKNAFVVFFGEIHAYFLERSYLWECAAMQGVLDYEHTTAQELYTQMKQQGVTHILLNNNVPFCPTIKEKLASEIFKTHMKLLYEKNNAQLFELEETTK